ncbi:MAG: hypothetical protein DME21_03665 [Verrucomicrobia bacterium]|nr:MAG: hypothetical protein DME21_03665 [Verrucomicrobiota bacterium]
MLHLQHQIVPVETYGSWIANTSPIRTCIEAMNPSTSWSSSSSKPNRPAEDEFENDDEDDGAVPGKSHLRDG